jgi:predicted nucleic acid-binding Zn ribbon protein
MPQTSRQKRKNKVRINGLTSLSDLMRELPGKLGIKRSLAEGDAIAAWTEIAGPTVAERARALRIEDKVLTVSVEDDTWRYELTMTKGKLLASYRRKFDPCPIRDIRFIGPRNE